MHQVSSLFLQVFDGHGGVSAAEFARDNLLELVISNECFSLRPGEALVSLNLQQQTAKLNLQITEDHLTAA